MPVLLGRSLEYATGIWDSDEPLPEIVIENMGDDPKLVVVKQDPAPGMMIVPEDTRITLTLGYVGMIHINFPVNAVYQWSRGPEEAILYVDLRDDALGDAGWYVDP